ncbi:MAG: aminopeptidase P family protein [Halanaerobiaceae bacterium]|nr:aminopeptidase P family protein [Halanaerobiaceae bacterium]
MQTRIKKVYELMEKEGLEALLIDSPENRQYLTGFTGTAGRVLFTGKGAYFITDFRYVEQAKEQTEGYEIVEISSNFEQGLNELLQKDGVKMLGFESRAISHEQFLRYVEVLEVELQRTTDLIEGLRVIKEQEEIEKIRKAVEITDAAFAHILDFIKPGVTEREIALELEFYQKRMGGEKNAFDFIVASGQRSALPHGVASEKVIEKGDFVTLDFGVFYQGYCSDLTRTVVVGEPDEKQREVYELVLKAQLAVIENVKAGMSCKEVDEIARGIIGDAGYRENFGHGLGHGIGLEIHEGPRVSFTSETILQTGMVMTNEPGIYIPGWGGVRIEDDLLITEEGCEVLNKAPKELIIL